MRERAAEGGEQNREEAAAHIESYRKSPGQHPRRKYR
jgi:hypothetical protein